MLRLEENFLCSKVGHFFFFKSIADLIIVKG